MNFLVVNPANKPFTNRSILAEPLDVLQIATIINKKFDNVKVIDMDVNRMSNNINDYLSDENIVVLSMIINYHYTLLKQYKIYLKQFIIQINLQSL